MSDPIYLLAVLGAMAAIAGWLGRFAAPVGGIYAATYIGGSPNLTAVTLHFGVTNEPELFAGVNVADGIGGALWLAALVIAVQLLRRLYGSRPDPVAKDTQEIDDARPITVISIGALLALFVAIVRGLRRTDLLLPGILVGSLGNAIGTACAVFGWNVPVAATRSMALRSILRGSGTTDEAPADRTRRCKAPCHSLAMSATQIG